MRDLWRPGGGTARLTYRLVDDLIGQLPPDSRTKTAMRNDIDPIEMAAASDVPRRGWGPHTYRDDILCRIGEAVDRLTVTLIKVNGGTVGDPAPWRRPGVLSADEQTARMLEIGAPVIDQLEAERAERERRRRSLPATPPKR